MSKSIPENLEGDLPEATWEHAGKFLAALRAGHTFSSMGGIKPEENEAIYQTGFVFYEQKRYTDAAKIFAFLVTLDHMNPKYLSALGGATYMLGLYEDALKHYAAATLIGIRDPLPCFHAAECLVALNRVPEAIKTLELAREMAGQKEEHELLIAIIDSMWLRLANPKGIQ